jgi:hypothetical protein
MNTAILQILAERINVAYAADTVKPAWTPFELAEQMLSRIKLDGSILVLSDLGFLPVLKSRGASFDRITFVAHTPEQELLANQMRVGRVLQVGYNEPIKELEQQLMGLKFDVVVGNPPYSGKTDIHYKFLHLTGIHSTDASVHAYVVPVNIFARDADRAIKYTAWMDATTMLWERDASKDFLVAEKITAFVIDRGVQGTFLRRDVECNVSFPALRVVGIDFGQTSKVRDEKYSIPVYSCLGADGQPKFHRFTHSAARDKLAKYSGKPVLHVNLHGNMISYMKVAWLDESGANPWFRQGIDSFVFSTLSEAKLAEGWINGEEGRKYIDACLESGWLIREQIQKIFREKS